MPTSGSWNIPGEVYATAWANSREQREREEQERLRLVSEWRVKAAAFDWLASQEIVSTPNLLWVKRHGTALEQIIRTKLDEQRVRDEATAERMAERTGLGRGV